MDDAPQLICSNPNCRDEREAKTEVEYQGEVPHGGSVTFLVDEFICESCGADMKVVRDRDGGFAFEEEEYDDGEA